jgi:hypothetical protein
VLEYSLDNHFFTDQAPDDRLHPWQFLQLLRLVRRARERGVGITCVQETLQDGAANVACAEEEYALLYSHLLL